MIWRYNFQSMTFKMQEKLYQQAWELRTKVFSHMRKTRGWKYRAFLRYLSLFKYIAFAPTRGAFLEFYYTLMRYLDDIVDGDVPLPEGYSNGCEYLSEKIKFVNNPVNPRDEVECLMLYCNLLAEKFKQDFHSETKDIMDSLLFDAKRRGKEMVFPEKELISHFHLLDVRGTIRATLKIFGDDPDKYNILEPLGIACRHQFNLEDFEEDTYKGYINISMEDCERFGISKKDIHNSSLPNIRSWLCHHAREGMDLLLKHHKIMPEGEFSLLEKAVFKVVYEIPARKAFVNTLSYAQKNSKDKWMKEN